MRGNYHIQVHLSFFQHKSLEIICNPYVTIFGRSYTGISFKDLKLAYPKTFEMNRQQTYRELGFYARWMGGTFVYDNLLSP